MISPIAVLYAAIAFYSIWAFPFIPQSMGGGKPLGIEIQIKEASRASLANLGLKISTEGKLGPANLISAEGDSFVITTEKYLYPHKAYHIPKNATDGVLLIGETRDLFIYVPEDNPSPKDAQDQQKQPSSP